MSTLPSKLKQWKHDLHQHPSKKLAWAIIEDYFRHYTHREIKDELWLLTVATLTHPEIEKAADAIDRHNRLFFFEHHQLLVEAVEVLNASPQE